MPSNDRRAAARRRAWGRGPIILRFESLESRKLLSSDGPAPDLIGAVFDTLHNLDWGSSFHAVGQIKNQGDGPVTVPFQVGIFASTNPVIGQGSVELGEATIPAGLQPGQSTTFDQVVSLPPTPIPGYSGSGPIYISLWVDPAGQVAESNKTNNFGLGQGYDTSVVYITPQQPSLLVGSSLGVYPDQTSWGQTVTVTAQVKNNAQGDAPPTRARLVLTPAGVAPGGPGDVTIGYLQVPAIPAWQTVNVSQPITLPAGPPTLLAGASQFVLSMIQDADYVTDPLYPHQASQGLGYDMALINIGPGLNADLPQGPRPDLAASAVLAPTVPIAWGSQFQVQTVVQNLGQADVGPFHVQFLLTGASGSLDHAIFLGDVPVNGLTKGGSQGIVQTLKLPGRLPNGIALDSLGVGRIAVVVDPDHQSNEALLTNNVTESNPVTLRVLGTDGTSSVPTAPPPGVISLAQPKAPSHPQPQKPARPKGTGPLVTRQNKLLRRPPPKQPSLTKQVEHRLRVFPSQVSHFVRDLIKNKN